MSEAFVSSCGTSIQSTPGIRSSAPLTLRREPLLFFGGHAGRQVLYGTCSAPLLRSIGPPSVSSDGQRGRSTGAFGSINSSVGSSAAIFFQTC